MVTGRVRHRRTDRFDPALCVTGAVVDDVCGDYRAGTGIGCRAHRLASNLGHSADPAPSERWTQDWLDGRCTAPGRHLIMV